VFCDQDAGYLHPVIKVFFIAGVGKAMKHNVNLCAMLYILFQGSRIAYTFPHVDIMSSLLFYSDLAAGQRISRCKKCRAY
jgi:hypothetical protein